MSNVPAHIKAPGVAQVFLLPPEVEQRRTKARQRKSAVLGLAVFLLLLSGGYLYLAIDAQAASKDAALEEDETTRLNAQLAELSFVDVVKSRLANAESAREFAASQEVFWPLLWSAVHSSMPENTSLSRIEVVDSNFLGIPTAAASPIATNGIGRFEITAEVSSLEAVTEFQRRLFLVPFLEDVRVMTVENKAASAVGETGEASEASETFEVVYEATLTYNAMMLRFSEAWFGAEDENGQVVGPMLKEYYEAFLADLVNGDGVLREYPPSVTQPESTDTSAGDASNNSGTETEGSAS